MIYILLLFSFIFCFDFDSFVPSNYSQFALGVNIPLAEFDKYSNNGLNMKYSFGFSPFENNKNLMLDISLRISFFNSYLWEYNNIYDEKIHMKTKEKLASLSFSPRYFFDIPNKNIKPYIGAGISYNFFYLKTHTSIKSVDIIDDSPLCDEYNDNDNSSLCTLFDLIDFFTLSGWAIQGFINDAKGIFSTKDKYGGFKIDLGIIFFLKNKETNGIGLEISYNIIPGLNYPILTKNTNKLVDFIHADYMSCNISYFKYF